MVTYFEEFKISKLFFRYSSMNAGKSTALIQVAYNYAERDQKVVVLKPSTDTKHVNVLSRMGAERAVDLPVQPGDDVEQVFADYVAEHGNVDCVLVDEAQFLTREQVNGLFRIAVLGGVPVIAYGIRNDFKTNAFEGSSRLLEIAHSLEELKTICRCGRKAIFNGRKIGGEFVREGSQVAIDGQHAEYESLCGKCYLEKVGW